MVILRLLLDPPLEKSILRLQNVFPIFRDLRYPSHNFQPLYVHYLSWTSQIINLTKSRSQDTPRPISGGWQSAGIDNLLVEVSDILC